MRSIDDHDHDYEGEDDGETDRTLATDPLPPSEIAALSQALSGTRLAVHPFCVRCKRDVLEGQAGTIYAYRAAGTSRWSVARIYCLDCSRREVAHPSRTMHECVASARLGVFSDVATQSHSPALCDVRILDYSGPTEGDRL